MLLFWGGEGGGNKKKNHNKTQPCNVELASGNTAISERSPSHIKKEYKKSHGALAKNVTLKTLFITAISV